MTMLCTSKCMCSITAGREQRRTIHVTAQHAYNDRYTTRRRALLSAGVTFLGLAGCRTAQAEDGPVDALVGTLTETEEEALRVKGTDLVKTLLERSEQNRDKNRRELQDKYCYRQAEDGVGDCAGLRLIPGATKGGVQKRPGWLNRVFGLSDDAEGAGEAASSD